MDGLGGLKQLGCAPQSSVEKNSCLVKPEIHKSSRLQSELGMGQNLLLLFFWGITIHQRVILGNRLGTRLLTHNRLIFFYLPIDFSAFKAGINRVGSGSLAFFVHQTWERWWRVVQYFSLIQWYNGYTHISIKGSNTYPYMCKCVSILYTYIYTCVYIYRCICLCKYSNYYLSTSFSWDTIPWELNAGFTPAAPAGTGPEKWAVLQGDVNQQLA